MTDNTVVKFGENSPEYVAYRLLQDIKVAEGIGYNTSSGRNNVDRKWILETYAECLAAVQGVR